MQKIKTAILFPTEAEARPFADRTGCRIGQPRPQAAGIGTGLFICGIGPTDCAAATASIIMQYRPERLILAGIAGAYPGSGLETGQTVAVSVEYAADLGTLRAEGFRSIGKHCGVPRYHPTEELPGLRGVTSNTVSCAGTPYLHRVAEAPALIENMEGAAFMAVCARTGVHRFAEVRTVSNMVGDPPERWDIPLALERLSDTLCTLLAYPVKRE